MPQPRSTIAEQLQRASAELDRLIADVELGLGSARSYDDAETRAQAISARVVAAFRGAPERPATVRVTPGRRGGVWA